MNGHYVYKYIYNGEIVYIGKNDTDLITRINQHKSEEKFAPYLSSDIYYMSLNNEHDTDLMETLLINKYKPLLNVAKKSNYELGIIFIEPEWKKYRECDFKIITSENKHKKTYNRTSSQSKKKLDSMIKKLSYYQDIHICPIQMIDNKQHIELAYDNNVPVLFSIEYGDWDWDTFKLFDSLTRECAESNIAMYELNLDGYKTFQDNFDLIIKQYKEKIIEFANSKGLDCNI